MKKLQIFTFISQVRSSKFSFLSSHLHTSSVGFSSNDSPQPDWTLQEKQRLAKHLHKYRDYTLISKELDRPVQECVACYRSMLVDLSSVHSWRSDNVREKLSRLCESISTVKRTLYPELSTNLASVRQALVHHSTFHHINHVYDQTLRDEETMWTLQLKDTLRSYGRTSVGIHEFSELFRVPLSLCERRILLQNGQEWPPTHTVVSQAPVQLRPWSFLEILSLFRINPKDRHINSDAVQGLAHTLQRPVSAIESRYKIVMCRINKYLGIQTSRHLLPYDTAFKTLFILEVDEWKQWHASVDTRPSKITRRHRSKQPFSPEEDEIILDAYNEYRKKRISGRSRSPCHELAKQLNRSPLAIRNRFQSYLDPDKNHDPLSDHEANIIQDVFSAWSYVRAHQNHNQDKTSITTPPPPIANLDEYKSQPVPSHLQTHYDVLIRGRSPWSYLTHLLNRSSHSLINTYSTKLQADRENAPWTREEEEWLQTCIRAYEEQDKVPEWSILGRKLRRTRYGVLNTYRRLTKVKRVLSLQLEKALVTTEQRKVVWDLMEHRDKFGKEFPRLLVQKRLQLPSSVLIHLMKEYEQQK